MFYDQLKRATNSSANIQDHESKYMLYDVFQTSNLQQNVFKNDFKNQPQLYVTSATWFNN